MIRLIELVLPQVIDDFDYDIVPDRELGDAEATTSMTEKTIKISESCYEAARRGESRYEFTLAHELGHLLLHTGRPVQLARGTKVKAFVDAEWQADTFAGAFLMPADEVRRCGSTSEIMRKFGVSRQAAEVRCRILGVNPPFLPLSIMQKGH
jgi:Zn-dependent peptidase ImmA (M78 family)